MRVQHLQGLGLQLCEGRSIRRDNINLFFFFHRVFGKDSGIFYNTLGVDNNSACFCPR